VRVTPIYEDDTFEDDDQTSTSKPTAEKKARLRRDRSARRVSKYHVESVEEKVERDDCFKTELE
jgi:hypothetical protein